MELVAFGSEEYPPISVEVYMPNAEPRLGKTVSVITIAYVLGSDIVMLTANSTAFMELVDEIKRFYPSIVWTEPWPQSNHSSFSIRSMAFASPSGWVLAHDRSYNFSMVSARKAAEVIRFAIEVVENLQDKDEIWTRTGTR